MVMGFRGLLGLVAMFNTAKQAVNLRAGRESFFK
jgi:hypothetical protein